MLNSLFRNRAGGELSPSQLIAVGRLSGGISAHVDGSSRNGRAPRTRKFEGVGNVADG